MRRSILLLSTVAPILLAARGVAPAVRRLGIDGPETLGETNGDDTLLSRPGC